ncbi:MAG: FMN-binding negative transcriptional regulator [Rhodoferax sp.]|jgi:transcriptional regulator|nr:FMN-binding negative transcriptional regulator [Rhodoferax sp.]
MYIPALHRAPDDAALRALIARHPLATWVCQADGALVVNQVPFVLDPGSGPQGRLLGHVARGNRVWRQLGTGIPAVAVFQGPQAYITPGWYPGKQAHGRVVPTWNYTVVHAHGMARVIDDAAAVLDLLHRLTDANEATLPRPWHVDEAPADYIAQLMASIVGIEITIDRLEGKWKLSQDEAPEDRAGTVRGLQACPGEVAQDLARLVAHAMARRGGEGA